MTHAWAGGLVVAAGEVALALRLLGRRQFRRVADGPGSSRPMTLVDRMA